MYMYRYWNLISPDWKLLKYDIHIHVHTCRYIHVDANVEGRHVMWSKLQLTEDKLICFKYKVTSYCSVFNLLLQMFIFSFSTRKTRMQGRIIFFTHVTTRSCKSFKNVKLIVLLLSKKKKICMHTDHLISGKEPLQLHWPVLL